MTALGEVVISTIDLFEAQANRLTQNVEKTLVSVLYIAIATVLGLGGLIWLTAAGFLQLRDMYGAPLAAAIMGLGNLIFAGGWLWYARKK